MASTHATQEFVPIKEVRNGLIVLKDNSLRAIIMASSINFALKNQDEQASVIYQFQNFLNSLDFPIQISVQSRRLDIKPYLEQLKERERAQTNELLRVQTREYIQFVRQFAESTNIMTKSFFVVVPYAGAIVNVRGGLFGRNKDKDKEQAEEENIEHKIGQLEQRVGVVEQGLIRTGVRTVRLGSEELIELYYKLFNPGEVTNAAEEL